MDDFAELERIYNSAYTSIEEKLRDGYTTLRQTSQDMRLFPLGSEQWKLHRKNIEAVEEYLTYLRDEQVTLKREYHTTLYEMAGKKILAKRQAATA